MIFGTVSTDTEKPNDGIAFLNKIQPHDETMCASILFADVQYTYAFNAERMWGE